MYTIKQILYNPLIGFNNKWWRKVIFMIFETDVVGSIYPQSKSYGGSGEPPFKVLEEIQSTMIKKSARKMPPFKVAKESIFDI